MSEAGSAAASGYMLAVAGIVDALIAAFEQQEPVNMTRLKNDVAKKFRLPSMPKVSLLPATLSFQLRIAS
ncbi:hypothetical protein BBJ28_00010668 [Nothophytophthora sp. Chile5]|nr:hypothetical protein BBJ28_00010668 [Nothophytophthora sp. Chile5]